MALLVFESHATTRAMMIWVISVVTMALVLSRPRLLLKTMPGSMALGQPGSELTSVAPVAIKGCVAALGLIMLGSESHAAVKAIHF